MANFEGVNNVRCLTSKLATVTQGVTYFVQCYRPNMKSLQILNNNGVLGWYSQDHFEPITNPTVDTVMNTPNLPEKTFEERFVTEIQTMLKDVLDNEGVHSPDDLSHSETWEVLEDMAYHLGYNVTTETEVTILVTKSANN